MQANAWPGPQTSRICPWCQMITCRLLVYEHSLTMHQIYIPNCVILQRHITLAKEYGKGEGGEGEGFRWIRAGGRFHLAGDERMSDEDESSLRVWETIVRDHCERQLWETIVGA